MKIWRILSPWLSTLAMMLVLLASIPASSWHYCDHLETEDHSTDNQQLQEYHQCGICDYSFSGFQYAEISQTDVRPYQCAKNPSTDFQCPELISEGSFGSRAPPTSHYHG